MKSDWMARALEAEANLMNLWDEYQDQRNQFGDNPIWGKHEDKVQIDRISKNVAEIKEDWDGS